MKHEATALPYVRMNCIIQHLLKAADARMFFVSFSSFDHIVHEALGCEHRGASGSNRPAMTVYNSPARTQFRQFDDGDDAEGDAENGAHLGRVE